MSCTTQLVHSLFPQTHKHVHLFNCEVLLIKPPLEPTKSGLENWS